MNKFAFHFLVDLFSELKYNSKNDPTTDKIQDILKSQIPSLPCVGVVINQSTRAGSYFGMIVFPKVVISEKDRGFTIQSYAVEIQKQMIDELSAEQLAAMLIHDISHNVLTMTVIERLKSAIYNQCKMTNMKVIDVLYNMDNRMRDIAVLDIANRTYKDPIIPGTDMYEADRLLVDMDIYMYFNDALKNIGTNSQTVSLTDHMSDNLADGNMASHLLKMVKEKYKEIDRTFIWLSSYIRNAYDPIVFSLYPHIEIEMKEELFGQKTSQIETIKPYDLQYLKEDIQLTDSQQRKLNESTISNLVLKSKCKGLNHDDTSYLIESIFKPSRPNTLKIQKELDTITFMMQSTATNYERLSLLDRIYDSIAILDRYLDTNTDETITSLREKFMDLISKMKDIKPSKRSYGIMVEYPDGYQG